MPLPEIIREEFIHAMIPYADKEVPDSIRFSAYRAAEAILQLAKKMKFIDKLPVVEKISYENGVLLITIDNEEIKITR